MLTLYHAPKSRSSIIPVLLDELGAADQVEIREVTILRQDGSGARDPANPHPEGKVPYLVNGDDHVRERGAMVLYLTDMFPDAGLGPVVGGPTRGRYLSWLSWYQGVLEPVALFRFAGISHPALDATFRDYDEAVKRIEEVVSNQPWLLGQTYSAADLLLASPFLFFGEGMPRTAAIDAWATRVGQRPAMVRAAGSASS